DDWREGVLQKPAEPLTGESQGYELILRPDPTIHDGRFANNAWLQELPKPLTKLTWDNAVVVSPNTAKVLDLSNAEGWHGGSHGELIADTVDVAYSADRREYKLANVPVVFLPGHPDGAVTLHYGYGRR